MLLHQFKAFVATWNKQAGEALNQIAPIFPGWIWHFPWLMADEMTEETSRTLLVFYKGKKLDWTQVRATIKAYLVVVRVMKHQYFSLLLSCGCFR